MSNKIKKELVVRSLVIIAVIALILALTLVACKKADVTPTPSGSSTLMPTGLPGSVTGSIIPVTGNDNPHAKSEFFNPTAVISDDHGNIYVSDSGACTVTKYSSDGKVLSRYLSSREVNGVAISGSNIYSLEGQLDGHIVKLDSSLNKVSEKYVGHTPIDAVIVGSKAYVACRFSNSVNVVDLDSGDIQKIKTGKEPKKMVLVGKDIYVACFLSDEDPNTDSASANVYVVDTEKNSVSMIDLTPGTKNIQGIAASKDGSEVYITHIIGRYSYPTTQLDRSWVNSNAFTVIKTSDRSYTSYLLDDLEKGAGNPYDVKCSADGGSLYISISGTQELIKVDLSKLNQLTQSVASGKHEYVSSVDKISSYIPFLRTCKTRIKLDALSPRDISLVGDEIIVSDYFGGKLLKINATDMKQSGSISLGDQPEMTPERYGEFLWNNASLCYQGWQSCSSCHPDGRADAFNWDESGDGLGTTKNTPSMLYSFRTPPVMKTGLCDNAKLMVEESVAGALIAVISEDKLEAMDAYLRSLLPVESPYLNKDGSYTQAALAGKQLFEEVGCAVCHPAPLYTDLKKHTSPYLGSDGSWENRDFDTPTLVEIWRSAPYIYDGSVSDISAVIQKFANRTLTEKELADLTEFVLSIGTVDEQYGVEEVIGKKNGSEVFTRILPGMTVDTVSLRCQTYNETDVTVEIVLKSADGKDVFKDSKDIKALDYGKSTVLEIGKTVPADFAKGGYLLITIKDKSGNKVSSDYKLVYNA